jgi:hypothetical protein
MAVTSHARQGGDGSGTRTRSHVFGNMPDLESMNSLITRDLVSHRPDLPMSGGAQGQLKRPPGGVTLGGSGRMVGVSRQRRT